MPPRLKVIIVKGNPHGYKYNVQLWNGNYYTGQGKFFKTKKQVNEYIKMKGGK